MNYIVYSKEGCPYCTKIVQVLGLIEAKFVKYKLGRDFTRKNSMVNLVKVQHSHKS